jgi:hypothetical protein
LPASIATPAEKAKTPHRRPASVHDSEFAANGRRAGQQVHARDNDGLATD